MWEVTRKGLLAHKFRLLLTSISIVLGVGFVAGTFVFTDTIGSVFDHLFTQTTSGTDAVVRAKLPFKVNAQGAPEDRAPIPDSLVPLVRSTPGVAVAQGGVNGYALVIGKDGKAVEGQAPTLGVSWGPIPRFAKSFNVKHGTRPTQPNEVGLDETTASKAKVGVGDTVHIVFLTVPPEDFKVANTGADIHASPDGRFLYSSNRGHDSIAVFRVDARAGTLSLVEHTPTQGRTPRNFAVDPTGAFLLVANQNSDTIVTFRRDARTGKLQPTGHVAEVPSPVCLKPVTPFP